MRRFLAICFLLAFSFRPATAAAQAAQPEKPQAETQQPNLDGLDDFINKVMTEWKVPGLAIAVVKDDKVIHAKGYGYRDVEKQLPVTSKTLFAIGSITKSFTVTELGMLVDEGKLDWDKPVRGYLLDFQLHDKVATEYMTARDLVTHRSGLPRHDMVWYGASQLGRKELYGRLRHLEPNKEFRSTWQYQNLMYLTAGYLAEKIEDTTWETLTRKRILEPLGMQHSNFAVNDSQKTDDFALPYAKVKDDVRKVPFHNIDAVGPAGSINSNVDEMIRYVQLHVNQGKHGDSQLLSTANAVQMQTPQMVMPQSTQSPQDEEVGPLSYGMGFIVTTYRGTRLVEHGGGIDGFSSLLSFLPRKKAGVVVLTNLSGFNPAATIVARYVHDRILGLDPVDWSGRVRDQRNKAQATQEEAKKKANTERKEGTSPSHALNDYTGHYQHAAYDVVKIELEDSALKLTTSGGLSVPLKHFHYDIFESAEDPTGRFDQRKVEFRYNKKGEIDRIAIALEPAVSDIVFNRVADESLKQKSFLELVKYMEACVQVDGFTGSLIVTKDGQPLLSKGYGWANVEHQIPNTPQTKFRLGSITKQFTAMAIAILAERGKLGLHDAISKHLTDAPETWQAITIHHLLTHTSGIPSYTGDREYEQKMMMPVTATQMIARFKDKPLEFVPGEKFNYSNSGYFLLGAIIEKVSEKTYEAFLKEAIFEPLGMKDTGYDRHTSILTHRAAGYARKGDGVENAAYLDMSQPFAAGSLYSTVEDLSLWDKSLVAGKLISKESMDKMYTPAKNDYAYGWNVRTSSGRKEISHGGGINGFNTMIVRYPDEKVCVIVLSNVVPTPTGRIANQLAAIALGEPYKLPQLRSVAKVDPKLYDAYVGRYEIAPGFVLTVTREGDRLMTQPTGQNKVEVFPQSETDFFLKVIDAQLTFVKDSTGEVTHVVLHQGGRDIKGKKLSSAPTASDGNKEK